MLQENCPIAVVGVSALFPGSTDAQGFWRDILAGRDLVTDVPASRWLIDDHYNPDPKAADKTYCKRGAFLTEVDFDAVEFGVPPSAINATDTCQLLALIVAKQVLEDALKGQFHEIDKDRASVILGVTSGQELFLEVSNRLQRPVWVKALRESGIPEDKVIEICDRISGSYVPWQENTFPGLLGNVVAGRIANRFNLGGTNCVTDAACASSLSALSMGISELRLGTSDLVITGGADTFNDISMYVCFSKTPALSPSGDCRPFSDRADGTILGEGIGMFALKRLNDAERDGNRIYAVITGIGSSSDGRSKSIYAPLPEGQAKALRRCYEAAGYGPETVDLVEAHGTGTAAGDAAEFKGLNGVFSAANPGAKQWCALGTVKSQIGHTKAAAGAAGLFKAVMALHHKVLPPSIKVDRPNPQLDIENTPFYLNTQARPWIRRADHPRRASLSSFGFGGTNFHVALEEYTGEANRPGLPWTSATELVLLSDTNASSLAGRCRELSGALGKNSLATHAHATQLSFNPALDSRLAVVCDSSADLAQKLRKAADALDTNQGTQAIAPGVYYGGLSSPGKIGFLFPGQGSQYAGMTAGLAMAFSCAREVWDLSPELADRVFPKPVFSDADREAQSRELTATEWAQPSIGAASAAYLAVLRKLGLSPDCVGGHSFGELPALYAAGGIDIETMLHAASQRGELMAAAATVPGGMLSIRHEAGKLNQWIGEWGLDLVVANHNGPKQAVLSGGSEAIAEAERRFSDLGIGSVRLPVSTAFHSPVVAPAASAFREFLGKCEVSETSIPFYSNRDGKPHPHNPTALRDRLAEQIAEPVNFHGMVEQMYRDGVRTFIEVGPGSVLTSLLKTIVADRPHSAIALDRQGTQGLSALWHGLGQIAVLGVPLDWAELRREHEVTPMAATSTEPRFAIKLNGGNQGRPYPPAGGSAALPKPVIAPPAEARVERVAPVAPAPVPAAPAQAYQIFQESIASAHKSWQANLAQGHESFLRSMESAYYGVAPVAVSAPVAVPIPMPAALPEPAPPPPMARIAAAPVAPVAPVAPQSSGVVLELIAEKTGYPVEMLEPTMALEADLGIDSIKRVEIFSALQERVPGMPEQDPGRMAALRTIADVISFCGTSAPAVVATLPAVAQSSGVVLELIAEKTGYPVEMLEPTMALEADLGIDSIKRVEIFSALQERVPGMPEQDPGRMAALRTIADVIAFCGASAPAAPSAPTKAPAQSSGIVLELIAEKTGYPVEMLEPTMALEADLGIDSIKRVEIFSALQERVPGMPEQDPGRMAALRTIADVIAFCGAPAPAAPPEPKAPAQSPGIVLELIAEKTGYPVEMLEPTMALEADLGIDSIKRVEIFSALQDRVPGMPEQDAARMAALRTIADVIAFVTGPSISAPQPKKKASAPRHAPRFVVALQPAPPTGHTVLDPADGIVSITDDGAGVAHALAALLHAQVVTTVPAESDAVICLAGLRHFETPESAAHANTEAFQAAKAVAKNLSSAGGLFIAVQDSAGSTNAWSGGISGLTKTVALEWPQARVKSIDIERAGRAPAQIARAIYAELTHGGNEVEVHLDAHDFRSAPVASPAQAEGGSLEITPQSVIVATGGARGVTAVSLLQLAKETRARLVLLGRTPLQVEPAFGAGCADEPSLKRAFATDAKTRGVKISPAEVSTHAAQVLAARDIRANISLFEKAGSPVRYFALDGRDHHALRSALAEVRSEWGPITGIVHGAGVLADKHVVDMTAEQFATVFSTKVDGLLTLLEATQADPLTFVCFFSSIAARFGNPGQAAYAAANEVLNSVARSIHGPKVKSLNWGPWDGGMVTPGLRRHFADLGVALIGLEAGTHMFVDELLQGAAEDVEVVLGAAPTPPARELRVLISRKNHPHLADHAIRGVPVLPVVEAIELFARAAGTSNLSCVKVLKGVQLTNFGDGGNLLTIRQRAGKGFENVFEMVGRDGTRFYEATRGAGHCNPPLALPLDNSLETAPWTPEEIYGKLLFHGPAFQVIAGVIGVSSGSIAGTLNAHTRATLMDGGLQLALLYGFHALNVLTLPAKIADVRLPVGEVTGPVDCRVVAEVFGSARIVCDIEFTSVSGEPIASLTGVELYATGA